MSFVDDELLKDIKKGDCFYKKNDRRKYHVVAVLKEDCRLVVKCFGLYKQWWHYELMSFQEFNLWYSEGMISGKRFKQPPQDFI